MTDIKEILQEVKESYAEKLGYEDWEACINDHPIHKVEALMDEVAVLLFLRLS